MKRIFKWAIEQYDKLSVGEFMAISWGVDETTDYHVIAERSYPDHCCFGTKVMFYDNTPNVNMTDYQDLEKRLRLYSWNGNLYELAADAIKTLMTEIEGLSCI